MTMPAAIRRMAPLGRAIAAWLILLPAALAHEPPIDPSAPAPLPPGTGQIGLLDPGFQHPPPDQRFDGVGSYQHLPAQDESPPDVWDVRNLPYWQAGYLDPVLTNACRLGDFASLPLNRMVVKFTAAAGSASLQIVLPDRRNLLVDTRGLELPGEIYYFKDSSYPTCQVWVEHPVRPYRRLNAQGNSLPPADPNALKKREAQIASWPKQSPAQ